MPFVGMSFFCNEFFGNNIEWLRAFIADHRFYAVLCQKLTTSVRQTEDIVISSHCLTEEKDSVEKVETFFQREITNCQRSELF
jgi:hypothetical protein